MAAGWTHDITSQKCLEGAYDRLWNANLFKVDRHHQPTRAVLPASAAHHRLMNNDWNVKRSTVKPASEVLRFGERRVERTNFQARPTNRNPEASRTNSRRYWVYLHV